MGIGSGHITIGVGDFTLEEIGALAAKRDLTVDQVVADAIGDLARLLARSSPPREVEIPSMVRVARPPANMIEVDVELTGEQIESLNAEAERQRCAPGDLIRHGLILYLAQADGDADGGASNRAAARDATRA